MKSFMFGLFILTSHICAIGQGKVGIGTTAPDHLFSVVNKFGVNGSGSVFFNNAPRQIYFSQDGLVNRMLFSHSQWFPTWGLQYTSNDNKFRFLADSNLVMGVNLGENTVEVPGKVGIGTPTPHAPLQFGNAILNRKIVLYELANNDHQYFGFGINNGTLRYQVSDPNTHHAFFTGNGTGASTELMRIQGDGKVGIGTTTPAARLDVNGAFKLADGSQGAGKILTSDDAGLASWQSASPGDPELQATERGKINMFIINAQYNDTMQILDFYNGGFERMITIGVGGSVNTSVPSYVDFAVLKEVDQFSAKLTQLVTSGTAIDKIRFYYTNTDGKAYHVIELRQVFLQHINYKMAVQADNRYSHLEEIVFFAGAIESSYYDPAVPNPLVIAPDYCFCYSFLLATTCGCDNN